MQKSGRHWLGSSCRSRSLPSMELTSDLNRLCWWGLPVLSRIDILGFKVKRVYIASEPLLFFPGVVPYTVGGICTLDTLGDSPNSDNSLFSTQLVQSAYQTAIRQYRQHRPYRQDLSELYEMLAKAYAPEPQIHRVGISHFRLPALPALWICNDGMFFVLGVKFWRFIEPPWVIHPGHLMVYLVDWRLL